MVVFLYLLNPILQQNATIYCAATTKQIHGSMVCGSRFVPDPIHLDGIKIWLFVWLLSFHSWIPNTCEEVVIFHYRFHHIDRFDWSISMGNVRDKCIVAYDDMHTNSVISANHHFTNALRFFSHRRANLWRFMKMIKVFYAPKHFKHETQA